MAWLPSLWISDDVLGPVLVEDIPEQLRLRFENEKKREYERRLEREEANNYCEISVILWTL